MKTIDTIFFVNNERDTTSFDFLSDDGKSVNYVTRPLGEGDLVGYFNSIPVEHFEMRLADNALSVQYIISRMSNHIMSDTRRGKGNYAFFMPDRSIVVFYRGEVKGDTPIVLTQDGFSCNVNHEKYFKRFRILGNYNVDDVIAADFSDITYITSFK